MSRTQARTASWSGGLMTALLLLTPVAAWLGPLAFAPLVALTGLLTLPSFRVEDGDRPAAIAILVLVIWAGGSTVWSPYGAKTLFESSAVKLASEAVLYGSVIVAARQANRGDQRRFLGVLVWGMAALGCVLLAEAATGAGLYQALRQSMGDPIRPDLAVKNVAQGLFILALLTPIAVVSALRIGATLLLAVPMVAGVIWPSIVFAYDAPLVALGASGLAIGIVWAWPRMGPRLLATLAAIFFLFAPAVVWGARQLGFYRTLQSQVSTSWSERMTYWRHAQDWIGDHPLRGWGLDASRMFGPGIQLHPHDSALQIWLELGLIGAVAAAILWVAILAGLGRDRRDLTAAACAGSAMAYLTFSAVSFGVWQEWWLAIGALACATGAALQRQPR